MQKDTIKDQKNTFNYHFAILIILSIIIRLPYLLAKYTLGVDDGIYAMSAKHVANGHTPFKEVFSSQGAWFLEIIALPMRIFGDSHLASRIVPLLAGITVTLVSYLIANRFMNANAALYCALVISVSGTVIRTTSAITSDGLMIAFSLLCVLYAFKFVEEQSYTNTILLGVFLGLGCSVKSIFMIPTILFLIYVTYKTSFVKRLAAISLAAAIFILPYLLFGYKAVWTQSIVYHLEKNNSLNLLSNIKKMSTTYGTIDIFIFVISISVFSVVLIKLIIKKYQLVSTLQLKSLYLLVASTLVLLSIQTPLFRNHLVILLPAICIVAFIQLQTIIKKQYSNTILISLCILTTIFITYSLIVDNQFYINRNSNNYKDLIANVKTKNTSVMLTNDVGLAFDANMDVPLGLEDTSKYRFLSKNKDLKIDSDTFANYLDDKNVCVVAINTTSSGRQFDIEESLSSDWTISSYDEYSIWLRDCK